MNPEDLPPIEPGDELDRTIKREEAKRRADLIYLVGAGLGASIAIGGAVWTVSGGPSWGLVGGFVAGVVVALVVGMTGMRQMDYEPSGEIEPPPPEPPRSEPEKPV